MEPICDLFINCIYDNNKPIKSLKKPARRKGLSFSRVEYLHNSELGRRNWLLLDLW